LRPLTPSNCLPRAASAGLGSWRSARGWTPLFVGGVPECGGGTRRVARMGACPRRRHAASRGRTHPSAADWRQPIKYDEPRFGTDGAPRGRNQPSGTSRRRRSSKQVFQHGEAGRRHGGHGERQYGASRGVRSAPSGLVSGGKRGLAQSSTNPKQLSATFEDGSWSRPAGGTTAEAIPARPGVIAPFDCDPSVRCPGTCEPGGGWAIGAAN